MSTAYDGVKTHGITAQTPKRIGLGAGTIHKGLKFTNGKWNFAETLLGATSGGNKLSITPEILTIEADGALVKVKGLDHKQGESASLEINMIEITAELIKTTVIGEIVNSNVEGYDLIESKADITDDDYFENIAFVGVRTDGKPIIAILDNALCTSGFEDEGKNKEASVIKLTFECYQNTTGDLSKLPYHIYYPTETEATVQNEE